MDYEIPLEKDTTEQVFNVVLNEETFRLKVLWNDEGNYFSLSIYTISEETLIENVKMVPNYPLIKRYKIEGMPKGELFLVRMFGKSEKPDYNELGESFKLIFIEDEIEDVIQ